jgi:DNA-binding MarR family transcriptional regulator
MKMMEKLTAYLHGTLGLRISIPKNASEVLLRCQQSTFVKSFRFSDLRLRGIMCVVATPLVDDIAHNAELINIYKEMKRYFDFPLLLQISALDARLRKKLIGQQVNFVVVGQQLHFPELYISLRESGQVEFVNQIRLSMPAQLLLLYHLQKASLENVPQNEIAALLHYSAKTVSQVCAELANHGIVQMVHSAGLTKVLKFHKSGIKLWEQIESLLHSQVQAVGFTDIDISKLPHAVYGTDPDNYTYAISSATAKANNLKLYVFRKTYRVQIWKYDPVIMSTDGFADPLSALLAIKPRTNLYLSRRDSVLATLR